MANETISGRKYGFLQNVYCMTMFQRGI